MRLRVINIKWPNGKTLPARMLVEVEDDTPAEDLPDHITYALWRATGTRPIAYEVEGKR